MWKFSPWRGSVMPKVWRGWELNVEPLRLALAQPLVFLAFSFRAGAVAPNTYLLHPFRKPSSGLQCVLTFVGNISVTSRFWIIILTSWSNTRLEKLSEGHRFQCFCLSPISLANVGRLCCGRREGLLASATLGCLADNHWSGKHRACPSHPG